MGNRVSSFKAGAVVDGRYEIISCIGAGGFSEVYKAKHVQMERVVALKIMDASLGHDDPSYAERFLREAKLRTKQVLQEICTE